MTKKTKYLIIFLALLISIFFLSLLVYFTYFNQRTIIYETVIPEVKEEIDEEYQESLVPGLTPGDTIEEIEEDVESLNLEELDKEFEELDKELELLL